MNTPRRLPALFALLMVLATTAFVIGVTVETSQRVSGPAIEQTHTEEGSEAHEQGRSGRDEDAEKSRTSSASTDKPSRYSRH